MKPHGTNARYNQQRCRCEPCRQAASKYRKAWKESQGQTVNNTHHWPIQPLLDAAGTDQFVELGYLTGFAARTVHRWKETGIPDRNADKAACALGLHPYNIWPNWFDPYLEGAA